MSESYDDPNSMDSHSFEGNSINENAINDNAIDAELQVRLMNLVMGEASDFERDQLQLMMEQRPELAAFCRHLEHLHGLLCEVGSGEPSSDDAQGPVDDAWKLSSDRRESLLAVLDGPKNTTESKVVLASFKSRVWQALTPKWLATGAVAAAICLLLGRLLLPRMQVSMSGQTLPSSYYLSDNVQYFPSGLGASAESIPQGGMRAKFLASGEEDGLSFSVLPSLSSPAPNQAESMDSSLSSTLGVPGSLGMQNDSGRATDVDFLGGISSRPSVAASKSSDFGSVDSGGDDGKNFIDDRYPFAENDPWEKIAKFRRSPDVKEELAQKMGRDPVAHGLGSELNGIDAVEAKPSRDLPSRTDGDTNDPYERSQLNPSETNAKPGSMIDPRELSSMERRLKFGQITEVDPKLGDRSEIADKNIDSMDGRSKSKDNTIAQNQGLKQSPDFYGDDVSQNRFTDDFRILQEKGAEEKDVGEKLAGEKGGRSGQVILGVQQDFDSDGSPASREQARQWNDFEQGQSNVITDVTVPDGGTILLGGIKQLRSRRQEGQVGGNDKNSLSLVERPSLSDGEDFSDVEFKKREYQRPAIERGEAIVGQSDRGTESLGTESRGVESLGIDGLDNSKQPSLNRLDRNSDHETSPLMMTVTPRIIVPEEEEERLYKGYLLAPSPERASEGRNGRMMGGKPVSPPQSISIDEQSAAIEAFSTFSLHVSDVSFKLAQSALSQGQWPEAAKIRIEEFVNALDYHDPLPSGNQKVACQVEQAMHPFLMQRNLLRVSMRTAATGRAQNMPLRLTLLLDNSGSMERPDRRQAVLKAFQTLVQQLTPADQVTLISFASTPRLLADKVPGNQGDKLLQLIETLPSEGGTNIESALMLAREKAAEQQTAGAQNRVVLLTDGAVNLGNANPDSLAKLVVQMRDSGIAFDAAGISANDLNDEVLEALTRQGDGRYYLLDSAAAAGERFASQIAGSLRPSAQNVKVQVEFNPKRVGRYKLLGFEKHRLNKEDFRNDKVDAAELAAAEAGVALYQYEIKANGSGDVGSVSVRFRDLSTGQMVENRWPIPYESNMPRLDQAPASMQLAATAALFATKLGGGPMADSVELASLKKLLSVLPEKFALQSRVQQLRGMIDQAMSIGR